MVLDKIKTAVFGVSQVSLHGLGAAIIMSPPHDCMPVPSCVRRFLIGKEAQEAQDVQEAQEDGYGLSIHLRNE